MRKFFKSKWFKICLLVSIVLIIFTVVGAVVKTKSSPLSGAGSVVFEPLQKVTAFFNKGVNKINNFFESKNKKDEEIANLKGQIEELQGQLTDYENSKQKIALYESFLEIKKEHMDYKVTPATVIGRDAANFYFSVVLNKGSLDGIEVNDPVIYGKATLVGIVKKVNPTSCVVSTILDPAIKVSAYDVRTRETGIISSEIELTKNQQIKFSGLNRQTAVSNGGIVCTSGVGGLYPRDLIVGTVFDVKNDSHDISSFALIKTDIDFSKLENAFILTDFTGKIKSPEVN